jgi:hypothetical protein
MGIERTFDGVPWRDQPPRKVIMTTLDHPANLPEAFRTMINTLSALASDGDSLSASVDIANNILTQGSLDAIFAASEAATISGENFIGIPFPLIGNRIAWRKSGDQFQDQGGFPFYALVNTVDPDGNNVMLALGGVSVAPTIFGIWDGGHLDEFGDKGLMVELYTVKTGSNWDLIKLRKYAGKKG